MARVKNTNLCCGAYFNTTQYIKPCLRFSTSFIPIFTFVAYSSTVMVLLLLLFLLLLLQPIYFNYYPRCN